jgi:hypothetical protein
MLFLNSIVQFFIEIILIYLLFIILLKLIKFLFLIILNVLFKITLPLHIKLIRFYINIYESKIIEINSVYLTPIFYLAESEIDIKNFLSKDYQKKLLISNQCFVKDTIKKQFLDQIIKFLFTERSYIIFDVKNKNIVYNNIFLKNIMEQLNNFEHCLKQFKQKTNNNNNNKNIKKEEIKEIKNIFKLIAIIENIFLDLQEFYDKKEFFLKKHIEPHNFKRYFKFIIENVCQTIMMRIIKFIRKQLQKPLLLFFQLLFFIIFYSFCRNQIYYYVFKKILFL